MEEKAKLAQLAKVRENMTPEECEAAARPTEAGLYWKPWNASHAAQRIFVKEVALIDGESRDKRNKRDFGHCTGPVNKWFKELPKSKLEEAEKATTKWNLVGVCNKDKMSK
jgi:hypothetical protein